MQRLISRIDAHRSLALQFSRNGDRHEHVIQLVEGPQVRDVLRSCEGDGQSIWPASPPLQQLSIEARNEGDVALLVGMAGRSHWSLSVETLPDGAFRFDVACRLTKDITNGEVLLEKSGPSLGSTYQCLAVGVVDCTSLLGYATRNKDVLVVRPDEAELTLARWKYEFRHVQA